MKKKIFFALVGSALLMLPLSLAMAQDAQKVTVTVGETGDKKLTLEPKEITVKPGKVEFTLINKGKANHNLTIILKGKETRFVRATPGQTEKSEPIELSAGTYEIFCNFSSGGSHKERGMVGKLIVK